MQTEVLKDIVFRLIQLNYEDWYYDFKSDNQGEGSSKSFFDVKILLKDIICLANVVTPKDIKRNYCKQDRYIIIGYDDKKNEYTNISLQTKENLKSNNLINNLRDKKFIGGIIPNVYSSIIQIEQHELLVITIKDKPYKPYMLSENFKIKDKCCLYAGTIYTRNGDSNSVKQQDITQIENMFRERLNVNGSVLEKLASYITNPEDWSKFPDKNFDSKHFYYEYDPLWEIEIGSIPNEIKNTNTVHMISNYWNLYDMDTNDSSLLYYDNGNVLEQCHYNKLKVYYNSQHIKDVDYLNVFGNRYPWYIFGIGDYDTINIDYPNGCYWSYLVKDSLSYNLMLFLIAVQFGYQELRDQGFMKDMRSKFKIPVFIDDIEKKFFKNYIANQLKRIDDRAAYFAKDIDDDSQLSKILKNSYTDIPLCANFQEVQTYSKDNNYFKMVFGYNLLVRRINVGRWVFQHWQQYINEDIDIYG